MKKIIALLLMLALCVSMMAGCSKDETNADNDKKDEPKTEEKNEPKTEENEEEPEYLQAEKPVEEFLGALMKLDGEKMAACMDDASSAEDMIQGFAELSDYDAFLASMEESMGDVSAYENELKNFYDAMIAKVTENISGQINSNEKVGDDYHIGVTLTIPNFENGDPFEALSSATSEDAIMEVFMGLYESGEITEDMSEEELLAKIMPAVFGAITESVNNMDIETETEEGTIVVSKIDGKWLINSEKTSDIIE